MLTSAGSGHRSTFRDVQSGYMCDKNIAVMIYYYGGMLVQTTRNIEKTTRTARQMAEVQRDSYQALAEHFAAAQRRRMGAPLRPLCGAQARRRKASGRSPRPGLGPTGTSSHPSHTFGRA